MSSCIRFFYFNKTGAKIPQTTLSNGEAVPNQELIDRVYGYVKAQCPCRVRDVIDAMQHFFPDDTERAEVKNLVVKALGILVNEEVRVFVGLLVPLDTEESYVYTIQ